MKLHTLIIRYTVFAIIATIANLATQRLVLWYDKSIVFYALAVSTGTLVGLVLKYLLDKRWIFQDISAGIKADGKKFTLYSATGLITTAIFWGTETTFWLVWHTDIMRELGAIIGLSFGYIAKYNLDSRYVFTNKHSVQLS